VYDFLATVNIGLEKIASKEISNLLDAKVFEDVGSVSFYADLNAIFKLNMYSRTINKLILVLGRSYFENLQDIYKLANYIRYSDFITREQTFAVRVERIGKHNFTSIDAAERIGQAIIDSYIEETGFRLKVNLDEPDVEIYSRIKDDRVIIGINTTGISLHKRGYKKYKHPSAISPTIAASMLYLANWNEEDFLIDPMCGGATIPIEAAHIKLKIPISIFRERSKISYAFKKLKFLDIEKYETMMDQALNYYSEENFRIIACDISPRHIKGAKQNVSNALVSNFVDILNSDARNIDKIFSHFDIAVLNPPYGKRSGDIGYIRKLYDAFLSSLRKSYFKNAVIITAAPKIFKSYVIKNGFSIAEEYVAFHGGLITKVFKIIPA
jgi:tRNA (guanine6-N2)-methyltransferase